MPNSFGDFQTPVPLVHQVLETLRSTGQRWTRILEPTCGRGNFFHGLPIALKTIQEVQAIEIQSMHLDAAKAVLDELQPVRIRLHHANVFDLDLRHDLTWETAGPLLVLGNPPWVTNATLGSLESNNVPIKKNIRHLRGIDALTGSSNFDIAEYILLKIIRELFDEKPTVAFLCKTSVARNVLEFCASKDVPVDNISIRIIDAKAWFGAAVDACLFSLDVNSKQADYTARVYSDLRAGDPVSRIGRVGSKLVADLDKYSRSGFVDGHSTLVWRQGIKHDAASVMELESVRFGEYRNRLGTVIEVEEALVFPLIKSSDLHAGRTQALRRYVLVPQRMIGEDTRNLSRDYPKTWSYLMSNQETFRSRKSSIYRGRPDFSMFGIGAYSFADYKVAISGFYKTPVFRLVTPIDGRPAMLDDTCYFIACESPQQAGLIWALLTDPATLELLAALMFSDSKRPITKKLLQRLDLLAVLSHANRGMLLARACDELAKVGLRTSMGWEWPDRLEDLLHQSKMSWDHVDIVRQQILL